MIEVWSDKKNARQVCCWGKVKCEADCYYRSYLIQVPYTLLNIAIAKDEVP